MFSISRLYATLFDSPLGLLQLLSGTVLLVILGCQPDQTPAKPHLVGPSFSGVPTPPQIAVDRASLPTPVADPRERAMEAGEACARCHIPPPPDALPKEEWGPQILQMATMPLPAGVDALDLQELADSIAHYEENAPSEWRVDPPQESGSKPQYRVAEYTPAPLVSERIPAVSFLTWSIPEEGAAPHLLAAEMRSGTILRLSPQASAPTDLGLDAPIRWNYPGHIAHGDINQDGRLDRIVAGLGGLNPTRDESGGVQILVAGESRPRNVGPPSNRVSDAQSTDLDGDGDTDLLVAAFGWRGEGQLMWYEQTEPFRFVARSIDERDGFIHVAPEDLDGDGDVDFAAVLAQEFEEVIVFVNEGGGSFRPIVVEKGPHPGWGYSGLRLVDLDGDGDSDFLVTHGDTLDVAVVKPYHGVGWIENLGNLRFQSHEIGSLPGCECAAFGDADSDGDLDVVAVSWMPQLDPDRWPIEQLDSVVLFERVGEGWRRHVLERGNPLHAAVEMGDLDGDGDQDIAVGNYVWMEEDGVPRQRRDYLTVFYRE